MSAFSNSNGFKPLAGRFFSAAHEQDVPHEDSKLPLGLTVVINETARRQLGYASPATHRSERSIGVAPSLDDNQVDAYTAEIIGVVTDFPMGSIRDPIGPTVFYIQPNLFQLMSVKLSGRRYLKLWHQLTSCGSGWAIPAPYPGFSWISRWRTRTGT